jgi:LacI family transcriptional regulator
LILAVVSHAYPGDAIFDGIRAFLAQHGEWELLKSARGFTHRPEHLYFVDADAYVVFAGLSPEQRNVLSGKGKPIVCIGPSTDFPYVHTDMNAVGALAAEHLLAVGYRHFAHLLADGSTVKTVAFDRRIVQAERPLSVLDIHRTSVFREWPAYREKLAAWLRKLRKPVGIFCESDFRAIPVVRVCLELGISIPHHVGVVGVEDLRNEPDLLPISLTSVRNNGYAIGFESVGILDTLVHGRPAVSVLVPPAGIDARRSTDVSMTPDPVVTRCLRILRTRMSEGLRVADMAKEVRLTPRMLQIRFLKAIGHTPHREIDLSRLATARQLLSTTQMTVTQIAQHCGCSDVRGLCVMFKRNTGMTPSQYRAESARSSPASGRTLIQPPCPIGNTSPRTLRRSSAGS